MRNKIFLTIIFLSCIMPLTKAQQQKKNNLQTIKWTGVKRIKANDADSVKFVSFEGANYKNYLPYYFNKIKVDGNYFYSAILKEESFQPCSTEEIKLIPANKITNSVIITANVSMQRRQPFLCISFFPFRTNSATGKIEKLISFNIEVIQGAPITKAKAKNVYADNSVLASGKWYKIAVADNGIYKLTYNDLVTLGMDVSSIDPKNIRIYGNGGGMLPEDNFIPRNDDLVENAIYVYGEADGTFDNSDYILFYGKSPVSWKLDTLDKKFHHQTNYYSDATYYFITADLGPGKRIASQFSTTSPANKVITKFDDYLCHEKDSVNLILSGKEWFGENFDILTSYSFNFPFPNIDGSSKVYVKTDIASRYSYPNYSSYIVNANGNSQTSTINGVNGQYEYASTASNTFSFFPTSSDINVTITKNTPNAVGWLNYIEINAARNLTLSGSQLIFRSISSAGIGNISEYTVANMTSNCKIWEVTNPLNIKEQSFTSTGNDAVFRVATDSLREFIAFNGSSYKTATLIGRVENQNLHALNQADIIIVAYPDFISEAYRYANIHNTYDNYSSVVVTPSQIYNEFSSGAQDVTAIRDFVKMFYDRATNENEMPKYLLLFGDASYDYKNRLPNNTNYVPTFQSPDGTDMSDSYATDDFFGFLDDYDGPYVNSLLDIGIGRFPVKTTEEADVMVNKINYYLTKNNPNNTQSGCASYSSSISGDWRNTVCFVADDEEMDFFNSAESLSTFIDTTYNNYNIDKIYCDAYVQQTGAGGQRYPDVNDEINKRVEKGALIVNYIGHGGEVGWALERILQVSDIESWTNINNMPMFLTATCEFSRYDDPGRTSAGEMVLLNKAGGGIALLTTSRLAYASSNQVLNTIFYQNVFKKINGSYQSLGDLTMLSKNGASNVRNFILLGDPALKLSYPENTVVTKNINGHASGSVSDTLKALSKVTISGIIQDSTGQKLTNFNGIVYPTVYDKKTLTSTLGNDGTSLIRSFYIQKSVLYKGKVSVNNGNFSFTFVVPKDIAYNYGIGRISYYAEDGNTNANGFYENNSFIIGGSDTNALPDNIGPDIGLYLNDTNFVYGGITDEKPILLAFVSDSNGINTVGNGIGHDIVAVIDENTDKSIVLNDYYEADLNSYQKGKIRYPLTKLSDGKHTLHLKVWDIYNNSSEANTEFVVAQSGQLALSHVLNYPNPFTTRTSFFFEHNQPCCALDVQIQIFTITGRLIKTIEQSVQTMGFRAEPIEWDGLDDFGDPIAKGVYIYKLKAKNDKGYKAEKIEKLVILR